MRAAVCGMAAVMRMQVLFLRGEVQQLIDHSGAKETATADDQDCAVRPRRCSVARHIESWDLCLILLIQRS